MVANPVNIMGVSHHSLKFKNSRSSRFKARCLRRGFFYVSRRKSCLAESAESAEILSPAGENLGHTEITEITEMAAFGLGLLRS